MMIDLTINEMWKILDAIVAYRNDYAVSGSVEKTIYSIEKKIKDTISQEKQTVFVVTSAKSIVLKELWTPYRYGRLCVTCTQPVCQLRRFYFGNCTKCWYYDWSYSGLQCD